MNKKALLLAICLVFTFTSCESNLVTAKTYVRNFLWNLKRGQYNQSHQFFSSKLKEEITRASHVDFMQLMREEYGPILGYTDEVPGLGDTIYKKSAFQDLFGGNLSKKNFNFLIQHQKERLVAQLEVIKENGEYKIDRFNLIPVSDLKDKDVVKKLKAVKIN